MKHLKPKPDNAVSYLAISCVHSPLQDNQSLGVVGDRIEEYKPDVILCLGDQFEADSASRWSSEYSWDLEHEFAEGNKVLRNLRMANPDAQCILLPGNHDDNLLSIDRIDKKVRGLCDWRRPQYTAKGTLINDEIVNHWKIPCDYVYHRSRGTYRIGSTVFAHGYECGAGSDRVQSVTLGWPHGLFISGHTHRPTEGPPKRAQLTAKVPLNHWYLNAGCMRKMDCDYMARKYQSTWGHGIITGWSVPINSPRFSKSWDAYCEVIKCYDE